MRSADILEDYLVKHGFTTEHTWLGEARKEYIVACSPKGNRLMFYAESPTYPFSTCTVRRICNNKSMAYEYMQSKGVSIPKTIVATNFQDAKNGAAPLLQAGKSVVVKPVSGEGFKGVSLDIRSEEMLEHAILHAQGFNSTVLLQEQFFGEEVRFSVLEGKVRSAILRQKPRVIGDGIHSLAELIEAENLLRTQITDSIVTYPPLSLELIDETSEADMARILEQGERLELSKSTMIRGGASMYDIIDKIDPSFIKLVEDALADFGRGFVVVDLMIADYTQEAASDNYVFIEFNLCPALALFYSCRDGRHFNIVEDYLGDMFVAAIDGGARG